MQGMPLLVINGVISLVNGLEKWTTGLMISIYENPPGDLIQPPSAGFISPN